tara:strand:- start:262 stop:1383 length:1122 start_codon:yes stop_codon:yes gene_type:complete
MLIYDNELPRIRLELGVLYFRLGAYALANNYLKSVKEFNPPPEVVNRVDQFLEAIEEAEEPIKFQQIIGMGFKHTTNGNSGINADFIEIGDFLLDVDEGSRRASDKSTQLNYSLSLDQDLNHPRGDNIQYFFSYGSDVFNTFKQFNVQSNVISVRRNFNLDENFFSVTQHGCCDLLSFLDIEDAVFSPNINLVRVVLNREEILRSGRISLDYSGLLSNGSSILLSYYRDEKSFATSPSKSGRINGFAFGQTFALPGGQGIVGYKAMIENFRGGVDYEFFENFGLELTYSKPLQTGWMLSSKYSYADKSHDADFPLFGKRVDRLETLRINLTRSIGLCWSTNLGAVFSDSRSTINIYKRSANNYSATLNYQCFK